MKCKLIYNLIFFFSFFFSITGYPFADLKICDNRSPPGGAVSYEAVDAAMMTTITFNVTLVRLFVVQIVFLLFSFPIVKLDSEMELSKYPKLIKCSQYALKYFEKKKKIMFQILKICFCC